MAGVCPDRIPGDFQHPFGTVQRAAEGAAGEQDVSAQQPPPRRGPPNHPSCHQSKDSDLNITNTIL